MKKKFLFPLLLLTAGTLFAATSCDNEETSEPEKEPQETETTTELLRKESISLNLYQKVWLYAEYDGEEAIVWTVADPTIVLLEDGALTGLKEGKTTVTVTVGDVTDSIEVTVAGFAAESLSLAATEPNLSLYKGDEKSMEISVCYDGMPLSVTAEKTYEVSDETVITVDENGKITAKDYGNASISVFCTVNGTKISTTVNVSVVSTGRVEITQPSVQLYMLASYGGQTYENSVALTAKVYERDVEQADANVVWALVDGQDIVTLSGNTLTAKNVGETTVTASYVDKSGYTQTDEITVSVLPVEVESEGTLTLAKNQVADGYEVDLEAFGITDAELLGAYVTSDDLTTQIPFENGKLHFDTLSVGEKQLYLQTRNFVYKTDLVLWTAIIDNANDLSALLTATDGWYQLSSDTGIVVKTQPIPVEVSIPIVQTNDLFVIRKSDVLTFSSEEIFSNSDSIGTLQNVATGETYDLTKNQMPARMLEGNEYRFIAYAENGLYGYEADYIFADLLVKTKEDLQNIQKDYPTGYVVLMNNIENVGAYTCKAKSSDTAFSGTLNGLGHIISGLSISGWQTGLFSRVADATVKNIAFEDLTITGGSVGLLGYTGNGKILLENLYMEYSFPKVGGDNSGLLDVLYGGGDLCLRNCILIANGIDKDENRVFSAISSRPSGNMKFENSYVITQGYLFADLMRTAARFNEAEFVFQTKDAFIADKTLASTLIDLSTYNEKYWDLTQGVPCFKR